jgi:hypothetical protein
MTACAHVAARHPRRPWRGWTVPPAGPSALHSPRRGGVPWIPRVHIPRRRRASERGRWRVPGFFVMTASVILTDRDVDLDMMPPAAGGGLRVVTRVNRDEARAAELLSLWTCVHITRSRALRDMGVSSPVGAAYMEKFPHYNPNPGLLRQAFRHHGPWPVTAGGAVPASRLHSPLR